MLCASLLLIPNVGRSDTCIPAPVDTYEILVLPAGACVDADGNWVTDDHLISDRTTQIERDKLRVKVDEAPAKEAKGFLDGILWGALGGVLIILLL